MLFVFQCWFSNRRSKAKKERLAADTAGARPPPPPPQTDDAAARSPGAKAKEHVVRLLRELREKAPEQAQREQLDTLLGQAEARAQAERERLAQLAEPPAADEPEGGEAAASSAAKWGGGEGGEIPAGPSAKAPYRLGQEATSAAELPRVPSTDSAAALPGPDPPLLERTLSFAELLGAPVGGGGGEAMDEVVDRSIPRSKKGSSPALEPVGLAEMDRGDLDIDVATCEWAMEALATVWAEDYDQLDARLPSSR